ncbi:MAG: glycosyltransferase family 9 protein [Candidatus Kapaibacterium sp.]
MIQRILLIRPDKIGDLVLTLPMATAIKASIPEAKVAFLVREYTAPLLLLATDVDETVTYDPDLSLVKTISLLRSAQADAIFFFGSKFKLTLAAFLARIPLRIGRAYWWYSFLYNRKIREHRKTSEFNEAEYNVRMLKEIGIVAAETPLPCLDRDILPPIHLPDSPYVVLHITTGGSAQAWNSEHFNELAAWLKQEFDCPIILTGTPEDNEFLFRISERMKHSSCDVHIHSQNTLLELASLLASARLVVSGSTGPGHLAAALGTATIGLFPGVVSLSKERWGFRGKKTINISPLTNPKKDCPHCSDCACIGEITIAQVINAIHDLNIQK